MKNPIILFLLVAFWGCKSTSLAIISDEVSSSNYSKVEKYADLETNKGKDAMVYGKIIRKEFENKAGKPTGVMETLLEMDNGETVNIRNKGTESYDYQKLDGKKVEMKAVIFYGNIDSDNPEHQSRVGFRIDYTLITILD